MSYFYNAAKRERAEKANEAAKKLLDICVDLGKLEINEYVNISTDYTRTGIWVQFELSWQLQGYNKYDKFRARRLKLKDGNIPTKKFIAKYNEVATEATERKRQQDEVRAGRAKADQLVKDLKLYSKYTDTDSVIGELDEMPKGDWSAAWGTGVSAIAKDTGRVKVQLTLDRTFDNLTDGQAVIDQLRAIFEKLEEMKA